MTKNTNKDYLTSQAWQHLCTTESLTDQQQKQFATYLDLLCEWNKKFNITAITDPEAIITDHFKDSLHIRHMLPLAEQKGICDIGSGGGFPALPLKICYPTIPFVLIEVNNKKIQFLQAVIDTLGLHNIELYSLDWRTFLRKTTYELDLFLARASLQPEELIRVLKPTSHYNKATLAYWASRSWQAQPLESSFIYKQESYTIGTKQRKMVLFKAH
ncbi:MAG: 16S rRNA (guanine(527)-N(7))-methyltransferase RsmG [Candidatus Dependentiae bacterium]|nr:16S rRNA (guanine(527)-N(7))-methyltransferase RsmG [Candidatus Dependentiae bacterium]